MAKLVNQHKRMAMGDKKSELYKRAYKKGGMVDCGCPEMPMSKAKAARGKK